MADISGFIVGKPAPIFKDYDGQFAHSQPHSLEPYSKDFTAFDDFSNSLEVASSLDNVYNVLFRDHPNFTDDPTYNPIKDPRLDERPDYLKVIYDSMSKNETEYKIDKYEKELDKARLVGAGNIAGGIGTLLGYTLFDPIFYATGGIASAVKGANFLTRFGKAASLGIAATIPFEGARALDSDNYTAKHFLTSVAVIGAASGVFSALRRSQIPKQKTTMLGDENAKPSAGAAFNPEYKHGNVFKNGKDGRHNFKRELEEEGMIDSLGLNKLGWNPIIRILNSSNVATRRLGPLISSIGGIIQKKNVRGAATSHSVEVEFRTTYLSGMVKTLNDVHDHYIRYAGGVGRGNITANAIPLAQAWIKRYRGAKDIMSHSNFRQEITKALRNGGEHSNPHIKAAAKEYRKFYDKIGKEAQEVDLFTRNLRNKLANLEKKKKPTNADKTRIEALKKEIEQIKTNGPLTNNGKFYVPRIHNQEMMMKEMDKWIDAVRAYYVGQGVPNARALAQATDDFDAALRMKPYQEIDDALDVLKEAGAARQRTLDIPDAVIARWLENDIELLTRHYNKQMGMDILFTKRFGDIAMKEQLNEIRAFHKMSVEELKKWVGNSKVIGTKLAKQLGIKPNIKFSKQMYETELKKLNQQLKNDLRDIRGLRDRVRGTYGAPKDPHRLTSRTIRGLKSFSVITLMGGAAISSVPDVGIMIMHYGLKDTFKAAKGLWGMNSQIIRGMNRGELHSAGEALEMSLSSRALALADVGDIFGNRFAFEKSLHNSTNVFMFMNGLNMWNTIMKETTGLMVSNNISRLAKNYVKTGKLSQKDLQRLSSSGIDPDMLARIGRHVNKYGETKKGFILPNTDSWGSTVNGKFIPDSQAVRHFRMSLTEDTSRTIVTPGAGDRALWTSTEFGSLVAQYKSFSQSYTQRVLTRGLQEQDAAFIIGITAMISLGTLVEQIKRAQYGQGPLTDTNDLLYAGIERSGVMGWFMDINNIAEKVSNYNIGLRPALGVTTPNSSTLQTKIGAVGGASSTQIMNALTLGKSALSGEFNYNTRRALRSLTPGNTLPWADPLMDALYDQPLLGNNYRF
jgi:polyhydroxyalkanoate synthesis regulator phasin